MRENRLYGSEGGVAFRAIPTPIVEADLLLGPFPIQIDFRA